ncbi:hypothetical protein E3N88_36051 [Mikania micrantha]|uniref:Uncharacterized protein n=1 Tax=Mikania micrantha TaxID=192012 RepID=A0A5N6M376_9ASTR|nr:hypothetical protein E3N88_36051 [Mikania micrantha]
MDEKALGRYAPRRVNMSGDARGSQQKYLEAFSPARYAWCGTPGWGDTPGVNTELKNIDLYHPDESVERKLVPVKKQGVFTVQKVKQGRQHDGGR